MTADINGLGPLAGWVIVLLGARTLIGKVMHDEPLALGPVYQLDTGLTDKGPAYRATPLLFLTSLTSLELPDAVVTIDIGSLSRIERKTLEACVLQADELVRRLRAEDSGIMVPPKGMKLPPLVGR